MASFAVSAKLPTESQPTCERFLATALAVKTKPGLITLFRTPEQHQAVRATPIAALRGRSLSRPARDWSQVRRLVLILAPCHRRPPAQRVEGGNWVYTIAASEALRVVTGQRHYQGNRAMGRMVTALRVVRQLATPPVP